MIANLLRLWSTQCTKYTLYIAHASTISTENSRKGWSCTREPGTRCCTSSRAGVPPYGPTRPQLPRRWARRGQPGPRNWQSQSTLRDTACTADARRNRLAVVSTRHHYDCYHCYHCCHHYHYHYHHCCYHYHHCYYHYHCCYYHCHWNRGVLRSRAQGRTLTMLSSPSAPRCSHPGSRRSS